MECLRLLNMSEHFYMGEGVTGQSSTITFHFSKANCSKRRGWVKRRLKGERKRPKSLSEASWLFPCPIVGTQQEDPGSPQNPPAKLRREQQS